MVQQILETMDAIGLDPEAAQKALESIQDQHHEDLVFEWKREARSRIKQSLKGPKDTSVVRLNAINHGILSDEAVVTRTIPKLACLARPQSDSLLGAKSARLGS